jgi:hypothetical protein
MPDESTDITQQFRQDLVKIGIISYRDQETLWSIAKRCARTSGVPMGAGLAVATASAGAVTIPGIGAVPGAVAGFLAGLASGTMMCTAANVAYRDELRKLVE